MTEWIRQSLRLSSARGCIIYCRITANCSVVFTQKYQTIQIHRFVYLDARSVASTRHINSLKNNLWWTSHGFFKAPKNRNRLTFDWSLNFLFCLFNRRNITLNSNKYWETHHENFKHTGFISLSFCDSGRCFFTAFGLTGKCTICSANS